MQIETVVLTIADSLGLRTNCYLLASSHQTGNGAESDLWVIDPADDWALLEQAIGGRQVNGIICTHRHFDHISALASLWAASHAFVYVGRDDADMVLRQIDSQTERLGLPAFEQSMLVRLEDGDTLNIGDRSLEVIHSPGHSQGGVCLYDKLGGSLFSGDTLFKGSYGRLDLPTADAQAMQESLNQLARLPDTTTVYPGHGETSTIGEERRRGTFTVSLPETRAIIDP
ncbi:MAG: MBL fold metallo-hydrolase [Coriobacteriia bacterium]|nr:MBL fold metallo-hydrolase [Coriobacteriia bacterium]